MGEITEKQIGNYIFEVESVFTYSDKLENTMEYLQGDRFKGVGPAIAKKIVALSGPDIFSYIQKTDAIPELIKATKLKPEKVEEIVDTIMETYAVKELYDFIQPHGGSYPMAENVYEVYKRNSLNILKKNPYIVGRETGLPFIICDSVAKAENITPFQSNRLDYMVVSSLYNIGDNGHTCGTLEEVYSNLLYLAGTSAFPDAIPPCTLVACMLQNAKGVRSANDENGDKVYALKELWEAENIVAEGLAKMKNAEIFYDIKANDAIALAEGELGVQYADKQKEVFSFLSSSGIKILTGGPGTGKSTTVNGFIKAYAHYHPRDIIKLCAPTGRAAQKMKEITGREANTIHRLLNLKPYETKDEKGYDVDPIDADLLVIDEFSMVDIQLFAYIIKAIKPTATVVLCGDTFQLPSVGPGNVLHDLLSVNLLPTVQLETIYRQQKHSQIVAFAQAIKQGDISEYINDDRPSKLMLANGVEAKSVAIYRDKELQLIKTAGPDDITKMIENSTTTVFLNEDSKYYAGNDILNFQILSSTKKDVAGTVEINKVIQALCQPQPDEAFLFGVGDKVMMTENNYDAGYYNGDIGIIKEMDTYDGHIVIEINGEEINVPRVSLADITLAYACTVHKSQGSEYEKVVISLPKEPQSMLQRNLLYTAVTRAKKYVAIIYEEDAISIAIKNDFTPKRKTNLKKKIKDCWYNR